MDEQKEQALVEWLFQVCFPTPSGTVASNSLHITGTFSSPGVVHCSQRSARNTVSDMEEEGLSTGSGVQVNVSPVGQITPSERTRLTATSVGCRTNRHPPRMAEMSGTTHNRLSPHLLKQKEQEKHESSGLKGSHFTLARKNPRKAYSKGKFWIEVLLRPFKISLKIVYFEYRSQRLHYVTP